jgi:hypothetical protein
MSKQLKQVAKCTYDWAIDAGALSTITPAATESIPKGALITSVVIDSKTALSSAGSATVAITAGGVTIAGATDFDEVPYSGTTPVKVLRASPGINTSAISTAEYLPIVATSTADIKVVVAGAALTVAGKFHVYVEYCLA